VEVTHAKNRQAISRFVRAKREEKEEEEEAAAEDQNTAQED
jgi:hypothetical protein